MLAQERQSLLCQIHDDPVESYMNIYTRQDPSVARTMKLLPIIIVVSLLAFFILLMLIILACQYSRSRARRREQRMRTSNHKPTRQLTVRSGKVIPIEQAMQQRRAGFLSVDLSSVNSEKSVQLHKADTQEPARAFSGSLRRFSAFADPEAQLQPYDRWHMSDKALRTLGQQHLKPLKPPVMRKISEKRKASITESLVKAYQGPPIPGSEPIELPASPLSRPLMIRKTSMKKAAETTDGPILAPPQLQARSKSVGRSKTYHDQKVRFQQPNVDSRRKSEGGPPSRLKQPSANPAIPPLPLAELSHLPTPPFIGTPDNFRNSIVEASEDFRTSLEIYDHGPKSFFSNSPTSSVVSSIAPLSTGASLLTPSIPAFSPVNFSQPASPSPLSVHRGIPNNPSSPQSRTEKEKETSGSPKYKSKRPPDIDTSSYLQRPYDPHPQRDSTISFIDSSSTTKSRSRTPTAPRTPARTPKEVRDLHRGPSVMSNRSDVTFAGSDISSTWTFGNARQMSIVPGVAPQQLSMPPVQRPKSKYRSKMRVRRVESGRGEKGLPGLPRSRQSPLAR
ncbi:MAG: hypothetical protein HETSPECPRED_004932 [Heterodermia speciosa]|uniref:Uncharacterized protein n=1 Tax=Heterodermia speciosa TaxID=116794 RepID=A0A8H3EGM2_9LECA|nr:MAG: hypothetical protein HETSPECPRED_004932 [Heterodermia speciosa]